MRFLVVTLLVVLTASARADTLSVSFTDSEGRVCTAEIMIDDATRHAVAVTGTDYDGREYSYALETFDVTEIVGCGSRMGYYRSIGCWYQVSPRQDGVICGIARHGGESSGPAMFAYRRTDPASNGDGSPRSRPEHN